MNIDFNAKQREFAAYLRDPLLNPAPLDVPSRRIEMYRELFFNNINNFLSSNFPVLHAILDAEQWHALAQGFFAMHRCESPYFSEIPEEFLAYLQNERNNPDDFPFLLELAHYEWVEMAVAIAKEESSISTLNLDKLPTQQLQLSPLAWPLAYQYPVHKISPSFLPSEAPEQPTFLVVYRDHLDDVNFLEITPMTYRLLEIIQENNAASVEVCLTQLTEALNHPNPEFIRTGGLQILADLVEKTVLTVVA